MEDLFARRVFRWSGIYGVLALAPMYFQAPPASGAEFYYGFIGVALAWQTAFFMIANDPARHRPLMLAGIMEKTCFAGAALALFALDRVAPKIAAAGALDAVMAGLFVAAYLKTERR